MDSSRVAVTVCLRQFVGRWLRFRKDDRFERMPTRIRTPPLRSSSRRAVVQSLMSAFGFERLCLKFRLGGRAPRVAPGHFPLDSVSGLRQRRLTTPPRFVIADIDFLHLDLSPVLRASDSDPAPWLWPCEQRSNCCYLARVISFRCFEATSEHDVRSCARAPFELLMPEHFKNGRECFAPPSRPRPAGVT